MNRIIIAYLFFSYIFISGRDSPNQSLVGSWVLEKTLFEEKISTMNPPEGMDSKTWEFGKDMVVKMFEGFSISLNEDYSFVESNPIGNPNTGKWSVDDDILIRNYDMNIMLKQSIEMYNRIKPKQDTFDSINEYKNAMLEYQNKIDQLMKVLYLESKYMIINGILEIEVDSPGPEGKSIKIIFPLKRQK